MLQDGIIEPSISAWNSPLLIIPKKKDPNTGTQKFRMAIDYRGLNDRIEDDKFPLPNITNIYEVLSRLKSRKELDPESRSCTLSCQG